MCMYVCVCECVYVCVCMCVFVIVIVSSCLRFLCPAIGGAHVGGISGGRSIPTGPGGGVGEPSNRLGHPRSAAGHEEV